MSSPALVFDRKALRRHRNRAAREFGGFNFLKTRAAEDLADSLDAIMRPFDLALDLGAQDGAVQRAIAERPGLSQRVKNWVAMDMSPEFSGLAVVADEERLPFASHSFDLIVSALNLHWVNDLPGALIQIRAALKPDGFFIAQLFGGATLRELRTCLIEAETELRGGAAMRVAPFADVQDMAGLMQRAGFAMPVADTHTVTVRYGSAFKLLADLRGMGETAIMADRSGPKLTRGVLMRAMELYHQRFSDPDGRVRARFECLTISGWAPSPDQPKPLRPGSASARLADALGVTEQNPD